MPTIKQFQYRDKDSLLTLDEKSFNISENEIHLWSALTEDIMGQYDMFKKALSPRQTKRAEAFVFDIDRYRYTLGNGLLRHVLAAYNHCKIKALKFTRGPRGKPGLDPDFNKDHLMFNLSHSDEMILIGIAHKEIGVDVEKVREIGSMDSIARQYFTPEEFQDFYNAHPEHRPERFIQIWTRKEAVLKAIGEGLYGLESLKGYQVVDNKLTFKGDVWHLHEYSPAPNYQATIALAA